MYTKEFYESALMDGKSSRIIAEETGMNARTIRWQAAKYGVKFPQGVSHRAWNLGLNKSTSESLAIAGVKISKLNKGKAPWNRGAKLPPLAMEHRRKISVALRGKYIGDKNSSWRGGSSAANKLLRSSSAFKEWRESIFCRDNFTCCSCGKRGGELHPHHIKSFAEFPELRFEKSNGQTLCKPCHMKTDSWGRRPKQVNRNLVKP